MQEAEAERKGRERRGVEGLRGWGQIFSGVWVGDVWTLIRGSLFRVGWVAGARMPVEA